MDYIYANSEFKIGYKSNIKQPFENIVDLYNYAVKNQNNQNNEIKINMIINEIINMKNKNTNNIKNCLINNIFKNDKLIYLLNNIDCKIKIKFDFFNDKDNNAMCNHIIYVYKLINDLLTQHIFSSKNIIIVKLSQSMNSQEEIYDLCGTFINDKTIFFKFKKIKFIYDDKYINLYLILYCDNNTTYKHNIKKILAKDIKNIFLKKIALTDALKSKYEYFEKNNNEYIFDKIIKLCDITYYKTIIYKNMSRYFEKINHYFVEFLNLKIENISIKMNHVIFEDNNIYYLENNKIKSFYKISAEINNDINDINMFYIDIDKFSDEINDFNKNKEILKADNNLHNIIKIYKKEFRKLILILTIKFIKNTINKNIKNKHIDETIKDNYDDETSNIIKYFDNKEIKLEQIDKNESEKMFIYMT